MDTDNSLDKTGVLVEFCVTNRVIMKSPIALATLRFCVSACWAEESSLRLVGTNLFDFGPVLTSEESSSYHLFVNGEVKEVASDGAYVLENLVGGYEFHAPPGAIETAKP